MHYPLSLVPKDSPDPLQTPPENEIQTKLGFCCAFGKLVRRLPVASTGLHTVVLGTFPLIVMFLAAFSLAILIRCLGAMVADEGVVL